MALAGTRVPFGYRNIGDPSYWVGTVLRPRGVEILLRRTARVGALGPEAGARIASIHRIEAERIRQPVLSAFRIANFHPELVDHGWLVKSTSGKMA